MNVVILSKNNLDEAKFTYEAIKLIYKNNILINPKINKPNNNDLIFYETEYLNDLLEKGHAKVMFISGVNPVVKRSDISKIVNPKNDKRRANLFSCCVFLGKKSKDTKSNAEETSDWMIRRHHSKALLVTSLEHMPRSIIEFHNNAPDIDIIPWPIITKMHYKWYNPRNYKTIILEYLRYTVIRLKYIIV